MTQRTENPWDMDKIAVRNAEEAHDMSVSGRASVEAVGRFYKSFDINRWLIAEQERGTDIAAIYDALMWICVDLLSATIPQAAHPGREEELLDILLDGVADRSRKRLKLYMENLPAWKAAMMRGARP